MFNYIRNLFCHPHPPSLLFSNFLPSSLSFRTPQLRIYELMSVLECRPWHTAACGVPLYSSCYSNVSVMGCPCFIIFLQKQVVLPLPSLEVLSDVSSYPNRHAGVMHVLETSVVMWLKQIKVSCRRALRYIRKYLCIVFQTVTQRGTVYVYRYCTCGV